MTKDERQEECVQKWVDSKCRGTIIAPTAFGKTRIALIAIDRFLSKNPKRKVLVLVPNDDLLRQWSEKVSLKGFDFNCRILTFNKAAKLGEYDTDLLIIDETHKILAPSLLSIFRNIHCKMILCLTATLEREDGMHKYLLQFSPVVDIVTKEESVQNGWISSFTEYKVMLDVDLTEYQEYNTKFYEAFAFFNYDFKLAMSLVGEDGWKNRERFVKENCSNPAKLSEFRKIVTAMTFQFTNYLQKRKSFIANHPKKIEITNKILSYCQDKKCITFSTLVKQAEKIKFGKVYSGKTSKKSGRITLEEFAEQKSGTLNTIMKCNEGVDIPDLSIGIILGFDSSINKKNQRLGRLLRCFEDKEEAKLFVLVLKNTVEDKWYSNSITNSYTTINEEELDKLLQGEEFTPLRNKESTLMFKY